MVRNRKYIERASYDWSEDSIRLINTPSQTAKSIYFYIQEAGYFKTKAPYFTERQNLNSFLLVYTISGKGRLTYLDEEYTIETGQCFYINCSNYHLYQNDQKEPWEFLWIHFHSGNALGYYEAFTKSEFHILMVEDPFLFERNLRRIIAIHQKKDITTEVVASQLITELLTQLIIQNNTSNIDIMIPAYIKQMMREIEKRFAETLSLDYLAAQYGVSKFHLSKEFKKYTGTTINEYIISTRISHSKELLKYSDSSIEEISYTCGVNNVSHFINLFKAREGMTPLAYRREWTTE